jgi:hypothetical protein
LFLATLSPSLASFAVEFWLVQREINIQRFLVVVDHPLDPVLEEDDMKVDEQPNLQIQQPKVRKELRHIHRVKRFFTFDFDRHPAIDKKVSSIAALELYALIYKGNRFLLLDIKPRLPQFIGEAGFIRRFKKSRPELAMDFDCRPDDLWSDVPAVQWSNLGKYCNPHRRPPESQSLGNPVFVPETKHARAFDRKVREGQSAKTAKKTNHN